AVSRASAVLRMASTPPRVAVICARHQRVHARPWRVEDARCRAYGRAMAQPRGRQAVAPRPKTYGGMARPTRLLPVGTSECPRGRQKILLSVWYCNARHLSEAHAPELRLGAAAGRRSRIYPTSATLDRRTRVNPSSGGARPGPPHMAAAAGKKSL